MTGLLIRLGIGAVIGAVIAGTVQQWRLDSVRGERDSALADVVQCEGAIAEQNARIDAGALECRQEVDAAVQRARDELRRPRRRPGASATEMNQWFAAP